MLSSACIEMGFFVRSFQDRFCEFFCFTVLRGSPLHDGAHLRDIGANASGSGKLALSTATIHRAHEVSPNAIHATALGMFPAASSPPHAPSIGCGQQEPPPHGYQARGLAVDAATR